MSSHHIVREDQEPALIIANGAECSMELLGQLLEWSPRVIVLDGAMERVLALGIKVDVWLGDFDRVQAPDLEQAATIKVHTPDQNFTDLEKAFQYLLDQGQRSANVVWASGRRMDHTINNLHSMAAFADRMSLVFYDDHSMVYPLPKSFKKWYPKGKVLSILPFGYASQVKSKGLKYPLNHAALRLGLQTSSSNEAEADGLVEIQYESGCLLMMECQD